MNAELPPSKNGVHNSKKMSTINRVITPLKSANLKESDTRWTTAIYSAVAH